MSFSSSPPIPRELQAEPLALGDTIPRVVTSWFLLGGWFFLSHLLSSCNTHTDPFPWENTINKHLLVLRGLKPITFYN